MSLLASFINKIIHKLGIEITRFPNSNDRRLLQFLKNNAINTCVDVGANTGQFATKLIEIGFQGNIISFEPQKSAFEMLSKKAANHNNWKVYNYALGDFDGESTINVSANSVSSSLLNIMPQHKSAEPQSQYINQETIQVKKLDTVLSQSVNADKIFLKIDTQGFESKVLKGAANTLSKVHVLELEMSCVELYESELLFDDMKKHIESMGFNLCSIESGFADEKSGKLLQIEAVFIKNIF